MFWSEIGSGFGEPGGTPLPKIPRTTPPGVPSLPWANWVETITARRVKFPENLEEVSVTKLLLAQDILYYDYKK